ncbi:hypothetical protein ES705_22799 [subsurface metagenome]
MRSEKTVAYGKCYVKTQTGISILLYNMAYMIRILKRVKKNTKIIPKRSP